MHNFSIFVKNKQVMKIERKVSQMKKKVLITLALATLLLIGCNNTDRANDRVGNRYTRDSTTAYNYNNDSYPSSELAYNYDYYVAYDDQVDYHYDFVSDLGFDNVVNLNGSTYHQRYQLNQTSAADTNIFHGWRHAWVNPGDYMNKDIDVYRYTGDYNGTARTIHIMSHNGNVLGGYHFGEGETAEHARMINHNGYFSRLADDFRETWNDLFNINS